MRFNQIVKGIRATRQVEFSIWGEVARCAVRPMTGIEEADVCATARAYAVSKGIATPSERDRVYEIAVMAHTLAIACVDVDDPAVLYFSSAQEVLENLDTDRIAFLYESQKLWEDECSSRCKSMTEAEWATKIVEIVGSAEDADFLSPMRPVMRLSFLRLTVNRLFSSLTVNSAPSTPSDAAPKNSAPASEG